MQRKAYENGVSALPQHIMNNFDIPRLHWLGILKESHDAHSITILHGASGQGKSSLAYRYLIDNYASNEIFVVSGIANQQQAIDISAALRELQKNEYNLIVYIDVRPYDKNWVWLIEQVFTLNLKIPVLVTIREEDFNRNPLDRNYIQYNDIELTLNEIEAQDLYNRYPTDKHISSSDSWNAFGEYNLLMEFIFFLRENESLKSRLQTQINKLILEEENVENWLFALLIISYAGRKEVPLSSKKLFAHIEIKNCLKMMQVFHKEYWVKSFEDNATLSSLHPVRALLLYDIILEKLVIEEESVLLQAIQFTDHHPQTLLVDFFYRESVSPTFIENLSEIAFTTWGTYAGVIESLLWLSVWQYYKKHKHVIDEGNSLTNNTFAFIMITDVTGYLKVDNAFLLEMLEKQNPVHFQKTVDLLQQIEEKEIDYCHVDNFMRQTITRLPLTSILCFDELTYCGFALFWHAQRGFILEESHFDYVVEHIDYSDVLAACEFCLGVQKQQWRNLYNIVLNIIKPILATELNIVYIDDNTDVLRAYVINDVSSCGSNHTKTMLVVDGLRLLYCDKEEYHITLIGSDILEGIPVLDNVKMIKNDKLPFKWITRLNGWFIKIDEYNYALNDWKDVFYRIENTRKEFCEISDYLCKAIDEYFKRQKVNKFINEAYKLRENQFRLSDHSIKLPKCATSKYGMSTDISNFSDISATIQKKKEATTDSKEYLSAIKAYNDYIQNAQNFLAQKDQLLIEKVKRLDVSNNGRLSYVNLMFALEKFSQMTFLFSTCFPQHIPDGDFVKDEESSIFLLGSMWAYVYTTSLRNENSVLYNKKRGLNQQRDVILGLIKKEIPNICGVQEVVYTDTKEVFVLLDILHADSFVAELYKVFSTLFTDFEYATLDFSLVASLIKKVNIQYAYNSAPTLGGLQIATMDFTKSEEEFSANIGHRAIGFDNYYWDVADNKMKCILTIIGLIESFTMIQKHIKDVLKYFDQMENNSCLIQPTIDVWKSNCNLFTKDSFVRIKETCSILLNYLGSQEQKDRLEKFNALTQSLDEIDDFLINLTVNESECEFTIAEYKSSFTNMIDFLMTDNPLS